MDLTETLEKFLVGEGERFEVGLVGDGDRYQSEAAVLFVSAPAEALKSARGNVIEASVDRNQVWEVRGCWIARSVAEALAPRPETLDDLVEAVQAIGESWLVIETTGDPAAPSR